MKLLHIFTNPYRWMVAASALTLLSGCNNGFVYEDLEQCNPRIRLSYTYNMEFDELREEQVQDSKVFLFGSDNALADYIPVTKAQLQKDDFYIPVSNVVADEKYDVLTWCGLESNPGADLNQDIDESRGTRSEDAFGVTLSNNNGVITSELTPIHYGREPMQFALTTHEVYEIPLTKDTNTIRVQLGKVLDPSKFDVYIVDKNDELDSNNDPLNADVQVIYRPVPSLTQTNVDVDIPDGNGGVTGEKVKGSILTFHTSRLFDPVSVHPENGDVLARIVIKDKVQDKTVIDEPLGKFLLTSKPGGMAPDGQHWTTKADQEYLDREDTYDAVFLIEDYLHLSVFINGWRVVIQNVEL
ncbi:MAG: FimB/Mfa2 family fimbrial subunit [Muribaculaceae bacterium]|nr:FimB/Mfa2 family fimbrial subunit [Muribaculaceae bacterium]